MDYSRIPEPLRSRLQEQLAALPVEVRGKLEASLGRLPVDQLEAVLSKSQVIQRLAGVKSAGKPSVAGAKSAAKGGPVAGGSHGSGLAASPHRRYDPHDHFNATIQRGDREMPSGIVLLGIAIGVAILLRAAGLLHL